ncbi:hypothetical protein V8F33_012367 [Rhypophila sp. PSN 637]
MRFHLPTITSLLLVSHVSAWVTDMDDKPFIDPFYDKDGGLRLEAALRANLPEKAYSSSHWSSGWLPDICRDIASDWNHNLWDIDAINVTYPDCSTPWVLCRHKAHPRSEQELLGLISRIPVRLRQSIATFIALPHSFSRNGDESGAAGTAGSFTTVWDDYWQVQVLLHEIGHSVDSGVMLAQLPKPNNNFDLSLSDPFQAYILQDKALNSNTHSMVEGFADLVVLAVYDLHVNPPVGYKFNPSWRDIQHAMEGIHYYGSLAGDIFRNNGRCNSWKAGPHTPVRI